MVFVELLRGVRVRMFVPGCLGFGVPRVEQLHLLRALVNEILQVQCSHEDTTGKDGFIISSERVCGIERVGGKKRVSLTRGEAVRMRCKRIAAPGGRMRCKRIGHRARGMKGYFSG